MNASPLSAADAAALAREVLSARSFSARARRLRGNSAGFCDTLRIEFLTRALDLLRKDPREAVEHARLATIVADGSGTAAQRAECRSVWAQACVTQGGHRAALHVLQRAMALVADDPSTALAARIDTLAAQAYIHLERHASARGAARRALRSHEARGDDNGVIWATMTLADLAYREDAPREALRLLTHAERRAGGAARPRLRGAIASNRANALEACHRFHAAARQFGRARAVFDAEGCAHTVAQVDYNAAYADALRGRYADALRRYASAEAAFSAFGDERHLAHIDLDRAEVHVQLGMAAAATVSSARAERRFRGLGLLKDAAQSRFIGARAAALARDGARATAGFTRAARAFRRLGLRTRVFQCTVALAQIAQSGGDRRRALHLLTRAEGLLAAGRRDPVAAASLRLVRAWLDLDRGDPASALRRADESLRACRNIHAPCMRIDAHRIRGRALGALGDTAAAIAAFTAAVDELERYRGGVPADEYMTAFLAARTGVYEDAVTLLVSAGHDELALTFVERARSRSLLDLIESRAAAADDPAAGSGIAARAIHLRERLNAVYGKILRLDDGGASRGTRATQRALREAESIESELASVLREQRFRDPDAVRAPAASAPDARRVRESLAPDTVLLECYLTPGALFTFVVTRDEIRVVRREVAARDVRLLVDQLYFQILREQRPQVASPDHGLRATRALLARIADLVIGGVREHLTARRIVVVPHGVLHQVPFHALPWEDGWLGDRFEIVCAPSAALYERCGRGGPRARGEAAVLALPDELAPSIEREAREVAGALGTRRIHLDGEATFTRLAQEVRDARIVHVATHGMFRKSQPALSSIRLADGWANAYDFYGLDVRSELVVLATCESGIAAVSHGDDVLGVTRGLLCAGARAVLTSQWRVDDVVTTTFMTRFYTELRALGDAAAAYRSTMAAVRAEHAHPYYWAAFFLIGQPTRGLPAAESGAGPAVPTAAVRALPALSTLERS